MLFFVKYNDKILKKRRYRKMTKVQYWRNERQLNRKELALKAGVSDSVIHRIEKNTGYGGTSIRNFYRIAKALDVPLEELIDYDLLE